jgi:hypothetical protein
MRSLLRLLEFPLKTLTVFPPRGHILLYSLHFQLEMSACAVERGVLELGQFLLELLLVLLRVSHPAPKA